MNHVVATLLAQADPGAEPQRPQHLLDSPWFVIILGFMFIYFFLIRPQRKEQDAKMALMAGLKKNDKVVTTGGMYGTIVNIKGDEITLRVDDQAKVKVRFVKSAIARVVSATPTSEEAPTPDEAKKS